MIEEQLLIMTFLDNFDFWNIFIPKKNFSSQLKISVRGIRTVQRVPALHAFWDLEKTVLDEFCVSGTVPWSPTNANSPTYTYISQKTW